MKATLHHAAGIRNSVSCSMRWRVGPAAARRTLAVTRAALYSSVLWFRWDNFVIAPVASCSLCAKIIEFCESITRLANDNLARNTLIAKQLTEWSTWFRLSTTTRRVFRAICSTSYISYMLWQSVCYHMPHVRYKTDCWKLEQYL